MSKSSIAQSEIEPIGGGLYRVEREFSPAAFGVQHIVPAGYVTDGASIPRLFWWVIGHPLTGEYQDAAIEHDWRCDQALRSGIYEERIIADAIFRYQLRVGTVPKWKRRLMYLAVRVNGWWTFRKLSTNLKGNS